MQQQRGSGKTAVLVERIINKIIKEKIDIDKILVVTFTNAAASEMRERILSAIDRKIEENPDDNFLQRQIILLNKANICTIHSFCLEVIRNNFFELDIPANFRIADSSEIELLKQDVIEELFEEKYLNQDEGFIKLINIYTGYRGDEPLKEIVLSLYKYIQSNPFPLEWLNEKVEIFKNEKGEKDFAKTIWGKILQDYIEDEIEDIIVKLNKVNNDIKKFPEMEKYKRVIDNDIENLEYVKKCLGSWDETYEALNNIKWEKWPIDKKITLEIKEEAKKIRDDIKKIVNAKLGKIMCNNSEEAFCDIEKMYPILKELEKIIIEFSNIFALRKKEKNIIDFNDIEHFALKILIKKDINTGNIEKTDIARNYEEKFIEIAVDEYQDSNLVQEYILNSISKGNNMFMVGDVKQSIYKFRQARPELFLEKYEKYPLINEKKGDNLKIKLFKNFRSRKNILDITNLVFQNIMSKEAGDIIYNEDEYLNLGANYENPRQENINFGGKAELHIIDVKENKEEEIFDKQEINIEFEEEKNENINIIENSVIEAKFVANKINELIQSKFYVFDKKEGYRKISYKDIVILLRATSNLAPIYEKELIAKNIPVFSDSSSEFLESIEIQTILSVLKLLDNPTQEIPLITVMRSNIGGFSDEELIKIRIADKDDNFYNTLVKAKIQVEKKLADKIENFLEKIDNWRKKSCLIELDELIWLIYTETNFYNYVGLMPNGALRQANLKMLFEKAKQYEDASFKGLYNFIHFIDKVHSGNNDMQSAKIIGENEDVVRIMSIHKSKGLEFPVVFLCGTGKGFNLRDLNDPILFHQDIGFGPKFIDEERRIEYNTIAKEAIKIKSHTETLSEEMRILYVALTRAKEKLIITGISKDSAKSIKQKEDLLSMYVLEKNESMGKNKINPKLIKKYKTYLDWIELVYLFNKEKIDELITLDIHNKEEILSMEEDEKEIEEVNILDKINENANNINYNKEIVDILNWKYQYIDSISIPSKTSVTKLKEMENQEVESEKNLLNILSDENDIDENIKLEDTPKFLMGEEKVTSSKKGTLMHLCMQKMKEDKNYSIEDIKLLISDLVKKDIILQNEAEAINIKQLYEYTKSELWKELKEAKEIHKEEPFYLNIQAKEVFENDTEDSILVQGIIDLYYINKNDQLILVDYKTDYINKGAEKILIERYKKQLELYKKALENGLQRNVEKMYIYSTSLNKLISL